MAIYPTNIIGWKGLIGYASSCILHLGLLSRTQCLCDVFFAAITNQFDGLTRFDSYRKLSIGKTSIYLELSLKKICGISLVLRFTLNELGWRIGLS
jgi:hypothetical protein